MVLRRTGSYPYFVLLFRITGSPVVDAVLRSLACLCYPDIIAVLVVVVVVVRRPTGWLMVTYFLLTRLWPSPRRPLRLRRRRLLPFPRPRFFFPFPFPFLRLLLPPRLFPPRFLINHELWPPTTENRLLCPCCLMWPVMTARISCRFSSDLDTLAESTAFCCCSIFMIEDMVDPVFCPRAAMAKAMCDTLMGRFRICRVGGPNWCSLARIMTMAMSAAKPLLPL